MRQFPQKNKTPKAARGLSPMDVALKFLSPRARSVREVERHLDAQQYGEFEVQQVVDRLLELGYLNDEAFAAEFIRTRLNTKPISRNHLREQLRVHELPEEIIATAIASISNETERENARMVAQKFNNQLADYEEEERRRRLYRRLQGRGYAHDDIRFAVDAAFCEVADDDT
ncbi:recombination regulator RecX [Christensenellaceae bacterium OttesenSCG-928-L17]|nr:recombination regulator RecX [Christensenellaceae bacterium OttesenSCG-928-L17]